MIGIFLFAGLVLALAGLLLFSSSKIFTKTGSFIVYFDTTLSGLNEGQKVSFDVVPDARGAKAANLKPV